jgi:hypothetical protein
LTKPPISTLCLIEKVWNMPKILTASMLMRRMTLNMSGANGMINTMYRYNKKFMNRSKLMPKFLKSPKPCNGFAPQNDFIK